MPSLTIFQLDWERARSRARQLGHARQPTRSETARGAGALVSVQQRLAARQGRSALLIHSRAGDGESTRQRAAIPRPSRRDQARRQPANWPPAPPPVDPEGFSSRLRQGWQLTGWAIGDGLCSSAWVRDGVTRLPLGYRRS